MESSTYTKQDLSREAATARRLFAKELKTDRANRPGDRIKRGWSLVINDNGVVLWIETESGDDFYTVAL